MHYGIFAIAASVALLFRILFPFLRTLFSPLRSIPGPLAARFTDLWYWWRAHKGGFEWDNIELHRKYGMYAITISPYRDERLHMTRPVLTPAQLQ